MSFFFGVMSKNVVDSVIRYANLHPHRPFTFIPSRRQIDYCKGYVMNWTNADLVKYVRARNGCGNIYFERDHGGPGQGGGDEAEDEDAFTSLHFDTETFDIIHIDPWKKYPVLEEGVDWTVRMIQYCYDKNPLLEYEIATEENIRPFTVDEMEQLILGLKARLEPLVFARIRYLVIQCGTLLMEGENRGVFDAERLTDMLALAKRYGLTAKEHNGDWVDLGVISQKHALGLNCFNIAPELASIETSVWLDALKSSCMEDYELVYRLCLESGKWKKWVGEGFDWEDKDKLIMITCHYVYSTEDFLALKAKKVYEGIDMIIQERIFQKLVDLFLALSSSSSESLESSPYVVRDRCVFCGSCDFDVMLENNYSSSLSLVLNDEPLRGGAEYQSDLFMPYNVLSCRQCCTVQNKYLGDLKIVYQKNHVDNYGTVKHRKHSLFADFICQNAVNIQGLIEVGACHDGLATSLLQTLSCGEGAVGDNHSYTIIEPSFTSQSNCFTVIPDYLENVDLSQVKGNTMIMSDVFEHFYEPLVILEKIQKADNLRYLYLNHPDFDYAVKNHIMTILNCEHTFLVEHAFLFAVFEKYGFRLSRRFDFEQYSLFLEFERIPMFPLVSGVVDIRNEHMISDTRYYFQRLQRIVLNMNHFMDIHVGRRVYLWPTSIHCITLLTLGLHYKKLAGVLDNSPNKTGKYLYGYDLLCSSFDDTLRNMGENDVIVLGGAGNYVQELCDLNQNVLTLDFFLDVDFTIMNGD